MRDKTIELILTDFDGTLIDTRLANFYAYKEVLSRYGIVLTEEHYNRCYGLRLKEFLNTLNITDADLVDKVKKEKAIAYPCYFDKLVTNLPLLSFLEATRRMGIPVAAVSTARRENIMNVLNHIQCSDLFDLIVSGEDIQKPKPDPECYLFAMKHFDVEPGNTLVFEDTAMGIRAALDAGANCLAISPSFYGL